MSKKLSILTSNQEVGDFVSKTSSSKLKLSAYNAYDDGSLTNSFIFDLTSNQMIMSLYDKYTDESYEKIKINTEKIIFEDDISVKGTLTTENLSVTGTTTSINTNQYNTENLIITNDNGQGPGLKINQNSQTTNIIEVVNDTQNILKLTNTGYLGIGIDPTCELHIAGDINYTGKLFKNGSESASSGTIYKGMIVEVIHNDYKKMQMDDPSNWTAIDDNLDNGFVIGIKPKSIESSILLDVNCYISFNQTNDDARWWGARLYRKIGDTDWTHVTGAGGDRSGPDVPSTFGTAVWFADNNLSSDYAEIGNCSARYLDNPNTIETVYYTIYWKCRLGNSDANKDIALNRSIGSANIDSMCAEPISSWTAQEIWNSGTPYTPVDTTISISSDNVGINNTNPLYTLDVYGNINFTGNLTQNNSPFSSFNDENAILLLNEGYNGGEKIKSGNLIITNDNIDTFYVNVEKDINNANIYTFNNIHDDTVTKLYLKINTYTFKNIPDTHPLGFVIDDISLLEVISGTLYNQNIFENVTVKYYTGNITIRIKGDFGIISYACYIHGYMGGNKRIEYNTTERNGGKIGIGTNKPTYNLEIGENSIIHNNKDNIIALSQQQYSKWGIGITKFNKYTTTTNGSGNYDFEISPLAGTLGNILLIPKGGYFVGINKTNPQYTLDINGNINFSGNLTKNGSSLFSYTNSDVETLLSTTSKKIGIGIPAHVSATLNIKGETIIIGTERNSHINFSTDEHTYIRGGKNSSHVLLNDNGGYVGIGIASPSYTLDVNGDINISSGSSFKINGSVIATTDTTVLLTDITPQLGGNLDVNEKDIVSTTDKNINIDPAGNGDFVIKGNTTRGSGSIKLNCENNLHGIKIKGPPHSAGASYTLTLPDNVGTENQLLSTDGSGALSFITPASSYTNSDVTALLNSGVSGGIVSLNDLTIHGNLKKISGGGETIIESYSDDKVENVLANKGGTNITWNTETKKFDNDVVNTDIDVSQNNFNSKFSTRLNSEITFNNDINLANTKYIKFGVNSYINNDNNSLNIIADNTESISFSGYNGTTRPTNTNTTERMKIDRQGNVGIGTNLPSERLHLMKWEQISSPIDILTLEHNLSNNTSENGTAIKFVANWQDGSKHCIARIRGLSNDSTAISENFYSGFLTFETQIGGLANDTTTERMRITNIGNVGIGVTDPSEILHILGNFKIETRSNETSSINIKSDTGGFKIKYDDTNNNLKFITDNAGTETDLLTMDRINNRIGIGTTSPEEDLHIKNGRIRIEQTSGNPVLHFKNDKNTYLFSDNSTGNFIIRHNTDKDTVIDSDGNVGIGTNNPEHLLHLKGGATGEGAVQLKIVNESYNKGIQFNYTSDTSGTYDFIQAKIYTTGTNYNSDLHFATADGSSTYKLDDSHPNTTLSTNLTIKYNGNVGIGTTTPTKKLDVNGDTNINGTITSINANITGTLTTANLEVTGTTTNIHTDNYITESLHIQSSGTDAVALKITHDTTNYDIMEVIDGSTNQVFTIDYVGYVGIGVTNPTEKLDINGNIKFSGTINNITTSELNYLDGTTENIKTNFTNTSNHFDIEDIKIKNLNYDNSNYILDTSNNLINEINNITIDGSLLTGTISDTAIPSLNANKITNGLLDIDLLPIDGITIYKEGDVIKASVQQVTNNSIDSFIGTYIGSTKYSENINNGSNMITIDGNKIVYDKTIMNTPIDVISDNPKFYTSEIIFPNNIFNDPSKEEFDALLQQWNDNIYIIKTTSSDTIYLNSYNTYGTYQLFNHMLNEYYQSGTIFDTYGKYSGTNNFKNNIGLSISIDLGRSIYLRKMKFMPKNQNSNNAMPKFFKIYATNSDIAWNSPYHGSWSLLHNNTNEITFNNNEFTFFGNFTNIHTKYRYFTLVVTEINGDATYLAMTEFSIIGVEDVNNIPILLDASDNTYSMSLQSTVVNKEVNIADPVVSDNSLIAHYKFDNNLLDSSGNNHTITLNTGTQTHSENGVINQDLDLDGTKYIIDYPMIDNLVNQDNFTIALWFKIDENNTAQRNIISKYDSDSGGDPRCGFELKIKANTRILSFSRLSQHKSGNSWVSLESTTVFNIDVWHHITLKSTTLGSEILIDGISEDITLLNGQTWNKDSSGNGVGIGAFYRDSGFVSGYIGDGFIDDMRFYNRELSQAEITSLNTVYDTITPQIIDSSYKYLTFPYIPPPTQSLAQSVTNVSGWTHVKHLNKNATDWYPDSTEEGRNFFVVQDEVFDSYGSFTKPFPDTFDELLFTRSDGNGNVDRFIYCLKSKIDDIIASNDWSLNTSIKNQNGNSQSFRGLGRHSSYVNKAPIISSTNSTGQLVDLLVYSEHYQTASITEGVGDLPVANKQYDVFARKSGVDVLPQYTVNFPENTTCDILIVGGGGGGGGGIFTLNDGVGGAGGAGGLVFIPNTIYNGTYDISVGNGGNGMKDVGENGLLSKIEKTDGTGVDGINNFIAQGGGGGGDGVTSSGFSGDGLNGGSGGGAGGNSISYGGNTTQNTYNGRGFGTIGGGSTSEEGDQSGGGGGAGGIGQNSINYTLTDAGGEGGIGLHKLTIEGIEYIFKDLFGTNVGEYLASTSTARRQIGSVQDYIDKYNQYNTANLVPTFEEGTYFAGGGGGSEDRGTSMTFGGLGGGGSTQTSTNTKQEGINGTGGGGTGGGKAEGFFSQNSGTKGGSGIVIIRYKNTTTIPKYNVISPILQCDSTNLISKYDFEYNYNDESGNGHHLTSYNTNLTYQNKVYDNCSVLLNGSESYLEFPDTINLYNIWNTGDGLSFSFWFNMFSNTDENGTILEFANDSLYHLRIMRNLSTNQIQIYWKENTTNGSATIPCNMNVWNNLVFSINKLGKWCVYLNNIDQYITITFSPPNRIYNHKVLGKNSYSITRKFKGSIDDFRIYNKVLSTNEIKILYESKFQTIYNISIPQGIFSDVILVGGGGSGGSVLGGGGGGGGVLYKTQNFFPNNNYIVRVGKGGDKVQKENNTIGNNGIYTDVMGTIVFGGGGGGNYQNINGSSGGSGGGGGLQISSGGFLINPQYGNIIINGTYTGSIGESVSAVTKSGDGGNTNGIIYSISGTSYKYSKGGVGSIDGTDNNRSLDHGINYGDGGGGGGLNSGTYSGDGGDGICIFKYTLKTTKVSNYIITTPDTEKVSSGDLILINGGGIRRVFNTTEDHFTLYNEEETDIGIIPTTAIGFTKLNNLLQFNVSGDIDNSSIYIDNNSKYSKITVPFTDIFTIKISAIFNLEFATEFCELHIRLDRSGFNSRYIRTFYLPPISSYEGQDSSTLNCSVDLNLKENDILIFESNYKLSSKLSSYITFTNAGTTIIQGSLIQNIFNGSGDSILTFQSPLVNVDNIVSVDLSQITTNNLIFESPLVKYNNNVSINTNSFAQYSHKHNASDIDSGVLNIDRIPSLTSLYSTISDIIDTSNYINIIDAKTSNIDIISNTAININGSVGINLGSVAAKENLSIDGKIAFQGGAFDGSCGMSYYHMSQSTERPFILFDSGGSTVIRAIDNNTTDGIKLQTYDNINRITIINNGNVGFGVDSPSYKLDVNGDINIPTGSSFKINGSAIATTDTLFTDSDVTNLLNSGITGGLKVSSGNVGIGTTSPQSLLHLSSGTSGSTKLILESDTDNNNETDTSHIVFRQDGGQDIAGIYTNNNVLTIAGATAGGGGGGGGGIVLSTVTNSTDYTTATEKFRVTASGDIGIGTSSPSKKLDVNGDVNIDGTLTTVNLSVTGTSTSINTTTYTTENLEITSTDADGPSLKITHDTTSHDIIEVIDSSANQVFTIDSVGNVGIGTSSPEKILDIRGNNARIQIYGNSTEDAPGIIISANNNIDNAPILYLYAVGSDDACHINSRFNYPIKFFVNNSEKLVIATNDNVGIGITTPSYKLDVNGDINIPTGSSFKINGSAIATTDTLYTDSDVTNLLNSGITSGLKVTSGKVGFGTSSVSHKLTVYGEGDNVPENNSIAIISDTNPQLMILGNLLTSDPSINLLYHYSNFNINDITTYKGNQIQTDGEYFRIISFNGDSNDRLRINSTNGYVGIGVTTPSYKLHVDGDINCTGNFKINGVNFVSNSYWSTTSPSTNTSDIFYNDNNSITGTAYSSGSIVTITGSISDNAINYKMGLIVQHSNRTQGLGIGYNGISQCGSSTNLNLHLRAKGTGTTQIGSSGGIGLNVSDSRVGISTTPTYQDAKLSINVVNEGTMIASPDVSQFLWKINSSTNYGIYWSTKASGNNYYINSDSKPNQIVFVGNNVSKAAISLTNGAFWTTNSYYLKGNGAIYWSDHGGGWQMDESTTIKVTGTKDVQCTNNLYVAQKIGIGTTNPQRTLDLTTTGQITFGNNVTNSANSGIYWNNNANYGIYRNSEAWNGDFAQLMIKFDTGIILDPGSGTNGKSHVGVVGGMSIGDTYYTTKYDNGIIVQGYVGIGTTTPSTNLDVVGEIKCTSLTVNGVSLTTNGGGGSSNDGISITNAGSSTNSGSVVSANLGIQASTYGFLDLRSNNNNGGWIDFSSVGNDDFKTRIRGYNNPQKLVFTTGATYNTTIDASGNLQVQGDITAFYSDERLKRKTDSINNVLSILDNINVFKYENNDLANKLGFKNNKLQIGLSAQEIKKYYPELVELAPFDSEYDLESGENISKSGENYLTLKYDRLVPVLLQGIKELNNKNKLLEEKNKKIENDLELIKNKLGL